MNAPSFLSPKLRFLFFPFAKLYALAIRLRLALFRANIFRTNQLSAPVISIGNITVGGTGKTPCTAYIANFLQQQNYRVAILSRGYKRETTGIVEVSDGTNILCQPHESGDEPYLLAQKCAGVRVVVNADRYAAGNWLSAKNPVDVFLLDDGFQHIQLARNLNILLLDATEPLVNYELLPAGKLREPLSSMQRADAVVFTRADQPQNIGALTKLMQKYCRPNIPIFWAQHAIMVFKQINALALVRDLTAVPVAALSCIAKPESFLHSLQEQKINVTFHQAFPDHHRYASEEFWQFVTSAIEAGAQAIVVTEKDIANLPPEAIAKAALPVFVAQLEFVVANECDFQQMLLEKVAQTVSL